MEKKIRETEIYRLKNIALVKANSRLRKEFEKIKILTGLLPICPNCKNVKDDKGYWKQVEVYISDHSNIKFTHGLCSDCIKIYFPEQKSNKLV